MKYFIFAAIVVAALAKEEEAAAEGDAKAAPQTEACTKAYDEDKTVIAATTASNRASKYPAEGGSGPTIKFTSINFSFHRGDSL